METPIGLVSLSTASEERRPWSDTKDWRGFLQNDAFVAI